MATFIPLLLLLLFLCFTSVSFSERCHPNDKKALLQIKKDLNLKPFKTDCCEWNEVTCHEKTNRTISFIINYRHLQLPIPPALGDLPYLQTLIFRHLKLTGPIPQALSKLSNLDFLIIQGNLLTGPVPSFLSKLKKLTYIDLSYNRFTGSIPPSLSQLPALYGLILTRNKLTGSIPESYGGFKQPNVFLHLSGNQLTGHIPRTLGSGSFFEILVSGNRLEGDISFLFGKTKSYLQTVDFSRNLFEFDLSKVEFPDSLQNLDLSHNKIYGSIPKGLTKVIGLRSLDVSYNRLCGKIPTFGKYQKFNSTSYSHNKCLCGYPLPKC